VINSLLRTIIFSTAARQVLFNFASGMIVCHVDLSTRHPGDLVPISFFILGRTCEFHRSRVVSVSGKLVELYTDEISGGCTLFVEDGSIVDFKFDAISFTKFLNAL
jgi:hypothetical protein